MNDHKPNIKLFESRQVRAEWDADNEKWWFSVLDIIAKSGVQPGQEYAALTDLMSKTGSGMSTREYRQHKDLKKENLRDNMTNTELVLNMLAEVAATDISLVRNPQGFDESAEVAEEGAKTAKAARLQLEKSTGQPVVSKLNAKKLGLRKLEGKK
jgi:hypothetical protein